MQAFIRKPIRFFSAFLCAGTLLSGAAGAAFGSSSYQMAAVDLDCRSPASHSAVNYEAYAPEFQTLKAENQSAIPYVWPVHFSEIGYISSYYGSRTDPITGEGTEFHCGIDLADREYSKIYAAGSGTVMETGYYDGYGLTIVIDHGNGYCSRYSHCASLFFDVGDTVQQGELIATMGNTGRSTGFHLDFRVTLNGQYIDPLEILGEN